MAEQTIIITGANSGIGFEASRYFAAQGAQVIMACRSLDKAEKAKADLLQALPSAQITVMRLDVSDLSSVRAFADAYHEAQHGPLDILINNAGIVAIPLERNAAGHELQLATNYLGAFALTGLMLPHFRQGTQTRIVNVCSLAHRFGKLNPEDLNWESTEYDQWKSYANSKVAMLNQTLELNRRLQASGSQTLAVGAHPGFANTNIHQNSPALTKKTALGQWFQQQMSRFIPTAADAARPIIMAATTAVSGGEYFGPGGPLEIGGKPKPARVNPIARDSALAQQLWQVSEDMTGVSYLS